MKGSYWWHNQHRNPDGTGLTGSYAVSMPPNGKDGIPFADGSVQTNGVSAFPQDFLLLGTGLIRYNTIGLNYLGLDQGFVSTGVQNAIALSLTDAKTYTNTKVAAIQGFSGKYSDLTGAPTTVSSFTNDAGYITSAALTPYVTSSSLASSLAGYVTTSSLSSTLSGYVTGGSLTSTLANYVSTSSLSSTLSGYVSGSSLSTTLSNYVSNSSLATTLAGYVSTFDLATALAPYATIASLSSYATTSSLSGYATTASLSSYATTASLGGYATTASLSGYATTGSLTSGLAGKFNTPSGSTAQYLRGDGSLATFPTNLSSFTNGPGYLTSISGAQVTSALGYTPYNGATNPNSYTTLAAAKAGIILTTTGSGAATYNSSTGELNIPISSTGTVTSVTAGTGLSGGTFTTTGTISMPAVGTAGTYSSVTTDDRGRVTAGTTRSFSSSTPTLNTAVQLHATRDVLVSYSVDILVAALVIAGTSGTVTLEYADNVGMTTNLVTVASATASTSGVLSITNLNTANLSGIIPAGKYRRLKTSNNVGTPTFTPKPSQESVL